MGEIFCSAGVVGCVYVHVHVCDNTILVGSVVIVTAVAAECVLDGFCGGHMMMTIAGIVVTVGGLVVAMAVTERRGM